MYHLEIYEPTEPGDDKRQVLVNFQSRQPFLSINVGDFINQSLFIPNGASWTERLRVVEVEHIIWNLDDEIRHKIMVYTESEAEDSF